MRQSIFCLQLSHARVSLLLTPKLPCTLKPYIKKTGKFNKELSHFRRGTWQSRTALHGFADRYLTDRPRCHIFYVSAKVYFLSDSTKFSLHFLIEQLLLECFIVFACSILLCKSHPVQPSQPIFFLVKLL